MIDDKTCTLCGRFYRGNGHKGVCTSECYWKGVYAKKHNQTVQKKVLHHKQEPKESAIQKANAKWLKDEKPKPKSKREKERLKHFLATKDLKEKEWSGKQYRAVRG